MVQPTANRGGIPVYRYAELWGYQCVDSLYKTHACDELQKYARQLGMSWRIFYLDWSFGEYFTCLKPGERIRLNDFDLDDLGADAEEVRKGMRDLPPKYWVSNRSKRDQ